MTRTLKEQHERIDEIAAYEENWAPSGNYRNSEKYYGLPTSAVAAVNARMLLDKLEEAIIRQPHIYGNPNDGTELSGINFEWTTYKDDKSGTSTDIEIKADGTFDCLHMTFPTDVPTYTCEEPTFASVDECVLWLMERIR